MARHPPTTYDAPDSEDVFRALADSKRQRVLQLLLQEELNVSELVAVLDLPQSTVSRHLKVLRDAGLVSDRRHGTTSFYTALVPNAESDGLMVRVLGWLRDQPLPKPLQHRLGKTVQQRRNDAVGFFEKMGHRWDELREGAFGTSFALEAFMALLPRQWHVLDVGAGTGFLLPALAEHFDRVTAVEPAEAMRTCCRARISAHNIKNVELLSGDFDDIPLDDASCDLAIACLVLHHVPKPSTALREIYRVCRPGGAILAVEQEEHEFGEFHAAMQDHWWGFAPRRLATDLSGAGFDAVRHHALGSVTAAASTMESPTLYVITGKRPENNQT